MTGKVTIREVGLRDGLQIIKSELDTAHKLAWIDRAAAAGFAELEVTSLVPEKYLPQFRDAGQVIAHANGVPGIIASVLVPNIQGAKRAMAAKARKITFILSASEKFSHANVRRGVAESLEEFRRLADLCSEMPEGERPQLAAGISCSFGCALEGRIPEAHIVSLCERLVRVGVAELVLADTIGYADPSLVRSIVRLVKPVLEAEGVTFGLHFHDTRGLGLANLLAAVDLGVDYFDAALGGVGGCPNSPGATGNIATEDAVFMLDAMGIHTGIDLGQLIELRRFVAMHLPMEKFYGHLAQVRLPTGYAPSKYCAA